MTLLNYYKKLKISPVFYKYRNILNHIQSRKFLYRQLGINENSIHKRDILEIAAGSGQNSVSLSIAKPNKIVLMEPNQVAINDIKKIYKNINLPHTKPIIINKTFQESKIKDKFDIVICENFLGTSKDDINVLKEIPKLIKKNGMLILTFISETGWLANLLRIHLAEKLRKISKLKKNDFMELNKIYMRAFKSHLETLEDMKRTPDDWIKDNLSNPEILNQGITIEKILSILKKFNLSIISTYPRIYEENRWFKSISIKNDNDGYQINKYHNSVEKFISYKEDNVLYDSKYNMELYLACNKIFNVIKKRMNIESKNKLIEHQIKKIIKITKNSQIKNSLKDYLKVLNSENLKPEEIANLKYFKKFFGKERFYVSLINS